MHGAEVRSFSSGKSAGGDEVEAVDADMIKKTANVEDGAKDLGFPGAQKGGKKLAIGTLLVVHPSGFGSVAIIF
jgi:hypothetical protein